MSALWHTGKRRRELRAFLRSLFKCRYCGRDRRLSCKCFY